MPRIVRSFASGLLRRALLAARGGVVLLACREAAASPLPVAEVARQQPVRFEQDVLPILRRSCLACHSQSERRGDLVLETVAAMRKGGDTGPAIVPGSAGKSLLFALAAHRDDPVMPPAGNDVNAKNLSAEELGLLAAWIDQGANSSGAAAAAGPRAWRPIAPAFTPALAVAVTADGQLVAVARGNRLLLHHPPSGRIVAELVDAAAQAAAHRDLVESLAFNRDGDVLASGGFREAKIWRRPRDVRSFAVAAGGPVTAVATSPDGSLVATAAAGGVRLWRGADGSAGPTLVSGTDRITGLAFTGDSGLLVAAAEQGRIRGWRTADGGLVGEVEAAQPARALAIVSPGPAVQGSGADEPLLALGGGDSTLRIFRMPDELPLRVVAEAEPGRRLAVSSSRKLVATVGDAGMTRLFAVGPDAPWRLLGAWQLDRGSATGLCVVEPAADGEPLLVTGHDDGSVAVWMPGKPAAVRRFGAGAAAIRAVSAAADGRTIVSGDEKGVVAAWRGGAADVAEPLGDAVLESVTATAAHPGRKLVAVAGAAGGAAVIVVRQLGHEAPAAVLRGHAGPVRALAFVGDGGRLVSGGDDRSVRVWEWAEGAGRQVAALDDAAAPVVAVAAAADGTRLLAAGADHVVRLWPVAEPAAVKECRGHTAGVLAVGFAAGGQPFSVAADSTVRVWNAESGAMASSWSLPSAPAAAALSPDRQWLLVAGGDGSLRSHQVLAGQVIKDCGTVAGRPAAALISAEGTRAGALAATPTGFVLRSHDRATGRFLEAVPLPEAAVLVSEADGIVTVAADGGLARHRGHLIRHFDGVGGPVVGLAVTAAGRVLAATADGSLKAYTLENGQPAGTAAHGGPITALAAAADGGLVATGGKGGTVRFWKADLAAVGPGVAGLPGDVAAVDVSADGRRAVVAVAAAAPVTVHDPATGAVLERFSAHTAPVGGLALVADGRGAVSAGADGIWRWPLAAVSVVAGHNGVVTAIAPGAAPREVITGCADGVVRRVRLGDGQIAGQWQHGAAVAAVAVRPDGQRIASVGESKSLKLWRADGQLVVEAKGDMRRTAAVARLTRQQAAATARQALAKQRADAAEKDVPARTEFATKAKAALDAADAELNAKKAALAAADQTRITAEQGAIAASTEARAASLAKTAAERGVAEMQGEIKVLQEKAALVAAAAAGAPGDAARKQAAEAAAAAVTAAGQQLKDLSAAAQAAAQAAAAKATAANEATKRVGDTQKPAADALAAVQKADAARKLALQQHAIAVRELETATVALPAARESLAAADAAVAAAKQQAEQATAAAAESVAPLRHVAFAPDGGLVATGGDFPEAHLWDGEHGTAVASFAGHAAPLAGVAFLPGGRLVTAAAEPTVIAWEVSPGWKLDRVIGGEAATDAPADRVLTVDFNGDATQLLVGSGVPSRGGELAVHSVADGRRVLHIPDAHDDVVFAARFSPDGRRIASGGADKYLRTFDAADGARLRRFEGHTNYVLGVAWKADGRTLATAGADGAVKIWDPDTADQRATVQPLTRHVTSIRFIGDGDTFVTGCGDRMARIMNVGGGVVRAFPVVDAWIHAVDATPGGDVIVAATADGSVRLWNGTTGQVLRDLLPAGDPAAGPGVTPPSAAADR